ncbi:MAG TPA: site-specific integrase [Solirubrobacterales bacterium]|nr:site-specific integrase [Solirubrobacterales bacterium]
MPRRPTGQVVPPQNGRGWALRFHVNGKRRYRTLGTTEDGWNRAKAEDELANVLADVRRELWEPAPAPTDIPTFHEFASAWFEDSSPTWRERTRVDYQWRLSNHLLPYFAEHRLSEITVEEVDRYRQAKVRESRELEEARAEQSELPESERNRLPRPLSNSSINKTIRLLAVVLEQAVEYGHLSRNPAKGRKRLLRESKPSRSYLQPDQVEALLKAAAKLDRDARKGDTRRRLPLLAVLVLAGLRIGELLRLRWRDVNLAGRKLRVSASKTDAGVREVELTPMLQELLTEYRTRTRHSGPDDFVFSTRAGKTDSPSNVRTRFLAPAVKQANAELREADKEPMAAVTPHSLRRTFISLLLAANTPVPKVMAEAGHSDSKLTLGIYGQVIESKTDYGAAVDKLIGGVETAAKRQQEPESGIDANSRESPKTLNPAL